MDTLFQCCGAEAARSSINLVDSEPELQGKAAPSPTAPTVFLMFNLGELSNMFHSLLYYTSIYNKKPEKKVGNPYVNFFLFKKS
jgi:hypothetical protein